MGENFGLQLVKKIDKFVIFKLVLTILL